MKKLLFTLFGIALSFFVLGQDKDLRVNLNEDGSHYIKATLLNQIWFRYTDANPGSTIFGEPESSFFDISLRRTRATVSGKLTDRTYLYFQFGQNNFNLTSPKQLGAFFHDAIGEYYLIEDDVLKVGGGLTIASGLSRFTQASIGTILTGDVPVFAQATTGVVDQFSRRLSAWVRGQVSKLDYRLIVSNPFRSTTGPYFAEEEGLGVSFANYAPATTKMFQGYFVWQFLEKESNLDPYFTGTYLGKKKVLNLGAGFIYQKDAMWKAETVGQDVIVDTAYYDLKLFAVDAFLDLPLSEKGNAVTAYAGFFSNDYGENYIRNVGVNNVFSGGSTFTGAGNAFPMMGTGNVLYTQAGYLFPKKLFGDEKNGTIQPYADLMYADYEALSDPMIVYNVGFNYLIKGHRAKLSLNYQSRPVFEYDQNLDLVTNERRGMYFLQYQLSI